MLKSILAALIATLILLSLGYEKSSADESSKTTSTTSKLILSHQQEVYLYALEWCESKGVQTAVNPKDRDGTPSYYSFQFKPDTFKWLVVKYGILDKKDVDTLEKVKEQMSNYELQKEIVKNMLFDKSIKFKQQFPDCVLKLGQPPKYGISKRT